MKVLFLTDTQPILEMYLPIMKLLDGEVIIGDYGTKYNNCDYRIVGISTNNIDFVLNDLKPDVVIMAREMTNRFESLFVKKCNDRRIPILFIPHGALMPNEKELWGGNSNNLKLSNLYKLMIQACYKIRKRKKSLVGLLDTGIYRIFNDFKNRGILSKYNQFTKIAAYGDAMVDILLKYNVSKDNIVVTGNPKYDKYYDVKINKQFKKVLIITDYLVEFGLWTEKQRLRYLLDIYDVCCSLGLKVEVLIHPVVEDINEYRLIIDKYNLEIDVHQMELLKMINECDICVTTLSTSGIEFMYTGKPLVIYNPYRNATLYDKSSGAYFAYNKSELVSSISEISSGLNEERKNLMDKFIYYQTYKKDRKSAERIAHLLKEMANNVR